MDSPQEGGSRGRGEDGHSFSLLPKSLFKTAAFVTISVHFKFPIQACGQEPGKTEGDLAVSYISWEKQFPPCGRGVLTYVALWVGELGGVGGMMEGGRPKGGQQEEGGMGWLNSAQEPLCTTRLARCERFHAKVLTQ